MKNFAPCQEIRQKKISPLQKQPCHPSEGWDPEQKVKSYINFWIPASLPTGRHGAGMT
ncbi:MAG: hypothetical protein ABH861_01135 [Patescibacteria group bacterium]